MYEQLQFEIWLQYLEEDVLEVSANISLNGLVQRPPGDLLVLLRDDLEVQLAAGHKYPDDGVLITVSSLLQIGKCAFGELVV